MNFECTESRGILCESNATTCSCMSIRLPGNALLQFSVQNGQTCQEIGIERNNIYFVSIKFCCASNAAIKMSKSQG